MTEPGRYDGLKKLPKTSVAEILDRTRAELAGAEGLTLSAEPGTVLAQLDARETDGVADQIRLLARALPLREGVWWSCLAGRDLAPEGATWATLKAAEAWVFKPNETTRQAALDAVNTARPDEESDLCARAAWFAEPTEAEAEYVKPGMAELMVELMVLKSLLAAEPEAFGDRARMLIDRALDIARGGNGTDQPQDAG